MGQLLPQGWFSSGIALSIRNEDTADATSQGNSRDRREMQGAHRRGIVNGDIMMLTIVRLLPGGGQPQAQKICFVF